MSRWRVLGCAMGAMIGLSLLAGGFVWGLIEWRERTLIGMNSSRKQAIAVMAEGTKVEHGNMRSRRDAPDLNTFAANVEERRQRDSHSLKWYLREIGVFGTTARKVGPVLLKELKPLDFGQGQSAAIALAEIDYREAIPQLIEALKDKDDWYFVAGAAEALGRFKAKEAEAALRKLADETPFSQLKQIALNALRAMEGEYKYSNRFTEVDAPLYTGERVFNRSVPEFKWWKHVIEPHTIDRVRRDFSASWIAFISPRVTTVQWQAWNGKMEVFDLTMLPRIRMSLRGGVLLGYDEGEFGSGLVWWSKGKTQRYFPMGNVIQIVPWPGGAIVIDAVWTDRMAYKVTLATDGEIKVAPFKRLPLGDRPAGVEADGALSFDGELRLKTDGEFEAIQQR